MDGEVWSLERAPGSGEVLRESTEALGKHWASSGSLEAVKEGAVGEDGGGGQGSQEAGKQRVGGPRKGGLGVVGLLGPPGKAGEAGLLAPWGGLEEPRELLGPWRGPIPHSPELSPSPGPSSSSSDSPTGGHKGSGPIGGRQEWGGLAGQCSHRAGRTPSPTPRAAPPPVSLSRGPGGAARGGTWGGAGRPSGPLHLDHRKGAGPAGANPAPGCLGLGIAENYGGKELSTGRVAE